ncbi:MAG: 3-dehydroquinate synthase [Deltaproteobacteria bacterium]
MHHVIEQQFSIQYSFPVVFCRDVFQPTNKILADLLAKAGPRRHRVLPFIDSGVLQGLPELECRLENYARGHAMVMKLVAPPIAVHGGEGCKNDPDTLRRLQATIEQHHLCRQSFILAIGGGAVLDAVGFAAATAHRGLRLIRIPTTVLGQNDAGVGVKNGVNAFGRIEAVKVALIKDGAFFDYLYSQRQRLAKVNPECMEKMIRRCAELHIEHIGGQGDPFEFGSSRPLDFGHWTAHKLEEITGGALNHGEAVAVGIALDTLYSKEVGMLRQPKAVEAVFTALEDLGLKLYHPALAQVDIMTALGEFQEHLGGELTITLLTGLGARKEVHSIDVDLMRHCIELLAARQQHLAADGPEADTSQRPTPLVGTSVAAAGGAG